MDEKVLKAHVSCKIIYQDFHSKFRVLCQLKLLCLVGMLPSRTSSANWNQNWSTRNVQKEKGTTAWMNYTRPTQRGNDSILQLLTIHLTPKNVCDRKRRFFAFETLKFCISKFQDNQWFVEKILDKKVHKDEKTGQDVVKYLLKWQGWGYRHCSWEIDFNENNMGALVG